MLKHIRTALALYTCIPREVNNTPSTADMRKAASYLPLIGWIIGSLAGLGFFYCAQYFSTFTAALVATAISMLFTSAVHEKGFARVCDEIANDQQHTPANQPSLGVHGILGLILVVLLKVSIIDDAFFLHGYLRDELYIVVLIFMCAHSLSRFMGSIFVYLDSTEEGSQAKADFPLLFLAFSACSALIPLAMLIELSYRPHYILILPPMFIVSWGIHEYLKQQKTAKQVDAPGAVQQVNELICLATFALIL